MQIVTQGDVPWNVYYLETATLTPEILDTQKQFCIAPPISVSPMDYAQVELTA